jgi:hypothetical protein
MATCVIDVDMKITGKGSLICLGETRENLFSKVNF